MRGLGPDVIGAEEVDEVVEAELDLLEEVLRAVAVEAVGGLRLAQMGWRRDTAVAATD